MHTTVIKFNTLADAVWTATKDHDFLPVCWCSFTLFLIGRVHVRSVGNKLCGTGIYSLVNRPHIQ